MKLYVIFLFSVGMLLQSTGLAIMARYPRFKWRVNAYGIFILGMGLILASAFKCFEFCWR
jgi:uncharacterized protein YybS (DUF2232 family)